MTEVEELYKERIQALERAHKEFCEIQELRFDEAEERLKTIIQELKAQADGLLGALGRLNVELADVREKANMQAREFEACRADTHLHETHRKQEFEILRDENQRLKGDLEKAYEAAQAMRP